VTAPRPWTLIAELTYACSLRCAYCSNPVVRSAGGPPLSGADWQSLLVQAEELGVVQVHFTGGEPLLSADLEQLVAQAHELGVYSTLVTSGVPLEKERLKALYGAGLEHVQLSLQGLDGSTARTLCGVDQVAQKLRVAAWVTELGLPLTLNVVLTRQTIDQIEELIRLAEQLGAHRLELANAQYLGWALLNREQLLPSEAAIATAREVVLRARERLNGVLDIVFVLPDYHAERPRACMDGWAERYLVVTPDGLLLPCHAAHTLPELDFDDVRSAPLAELWQRSAALQRFRGDAWMSEPCSSCPSRHTDRGGCRCQAYALTGDASAPDPACGLVPSHHLVKSARVEAGRSELVPLRLRRAPSALVALSQ
jgi:PqqA peptide cyclase